MRALAHFIAVTLAVALALANSAAGAAKFKVLHSFCGGHHRVCGDGSNPQGALVMDQAGNFFGSTATGGFGLGAIFELERKLNGGFNFKTLYRFCTGGTCGFNPNGALVIDTEGNLYGTATNLVFELSPGGQRGLWTEKVLHRFCDDNCGDGNGARGGLTYTGASSGVPYDGVSPLFGTTSGGGANNSGTVFELTNNGGQWSEAVLYSFCSQGGKNCTDGSAPIASVLLDSSGNIFGMTVQGGGNDPILDGAGVIFELSPADGGSWSEITLYRFCSLQNCADGARPWAGLTLDSTGALFGTTRLGGGKCPALSLDGCGVIFKLVPNGVGPQETVLYSFCRKADCKDGAIPTAGLALGDDGSLLGTTNLGGGNDIDANGLGGGVVFELSPDTGAYKVLHSFCSAANCADGEYPEAGLIMNSFGEALGTTNLGGANGEDTSGGTVFRLTP